MLKIIEAAVNVLRKKQVDGEKIMIYIIGRVTKDLEPQTSQSGVRFVSFDVAENKGFGDKTKTQFHRCTIWGE